MAADFEINKIAQILDVNILVYTEENNYLKIKGIYFGSEDNHKIIPLHFVNNNHFQVLYPKLYNFPIIPLPFNDKYLNEKMKRNIIKLSLNYL